jgi:hypothetical protein
MLFVRVGAAQIASGLHKLAEPAVVTRRDSRWPALAVVVISATSTLASMSFG